MKRIMTVVICLVCFFAGFIFTAETKAAGDGPVVELFESSVDIGIIPDQVEDITGQIIIFNKGTEDLKILKVTGPCSCFKGYDGNKVIEPDGNGLIYAHFDKSAIPAGKITRKAILTTNDPAKKQGVMKRPAGSFW